MIVSLIAWDHQLFVKINNDWANAFFDQIFPVITDLNESPVALALLAGFLVLWIVRERSRALRWILVAAGALAVTDMFAFRVLKPLVSRNRPAFSGVAYVLRTNIHHGNSFPSNHASNMFALAVVLGAALPRGRWLFYFIAFLVAYSRVYVGVHFPLDIAAGAITGLVIGWLAVRLLGPWADRIRHGGGSSRARAKGRSA